MEIWERAEELLKKIPKDYYLPIGVGCIGLILFAYGFYSLVYQPKLRENNISSKFSQSSSNQNLASISPQIGIKIDVEGAVVNPGVYSLSSDARVQDGLVAAGGLSQSANRQWVTEHINLALKLTDGTKIYIPSYADVSSGSTVQASGQVNAGGVLGAENQQIDINSASASDLDSLPGIGPATAQKIVDGRPYASTQDLLNKKIVGPKEFEKIKDLIIVE